MTIMTIKINDETSVEGVGPSWSVAGAKSQFSALIDRALADGPQVVTRKGRPAVVVVSVEEWVRKTKRTGTLTEFFAASPLRGADLKIERIKDTPRSIDL
jgi:prevent-host-death family protein